MTILNFSEEECEIINLNEKFKNYIIKDILKESSNDFIHNTNNYNYEFCMKISISSIFLYINELYVNYIDEYNIPIEFNKFFKDNFWDLIA